jgi:hypothetical protein
VASARVREASRARSWPLRLRPDPRRVIKLAAMLGAVAHPRHATQWVESVAERAIQPDLGRRP